MILRAKNVRPEETFEKLLGLGASWKVVRTDYEVERNTFVICVAETEALWPEESSRCGQSVTCYDHVEPMQWRHLNVFNKECVIVSALPRGRRSQDGTVYRVTPPWEGRSKHFSKEFEAFALTLMREMPVKKDGFLRVGAGAGRRASGAFMAKCLGFRGFWVERAGINIFAGVEFHMAQGVARRKWGFCAELTIPLNLSEL